MATSQLLSASSVEPPDSPTPAISPRGVQRRLPRVVACRDPLKISGLDERPENISKFCFPLSLFSHSLCPATEREYRDSL